ncbi:Chitotriosidase-1 [Nymphon striatum]|nr:Chitotriosidase-1 [Nymphon striatum]
MLSSDESCQVFDDLGSEWELSDELFHGLDKCVYLLYSQPTCTNVNMDRYNLFKMRYSSESSLLPNSDSLRHHSTRACYQDAIHQRSLNQIMSAPNSINYGWQLEKGELSYVWMKQPPAPPNVMKTVTVDVSKLGIRINSAHIKEEIYPALSFFEKEKASSLCSKDSFQEDELVKYLYKVYLVFYDLKLQWSFLFALPEKPKKRNAYGWTPDNTDPHLCTHMTFSFADVIGNQLVPHRTKDPLYYTMLNDLKKIKPTLKTILSVGGGRSIKDFPYMASTAENRSIFVNQSIELLRKYNFDGIDIDWEFPTSAQKTHFTKFLKVLHEGLVHESKLSGREKMILICSVVSTEPGISSFYETDKLEPYIDFLNIMAYDYRRYDARHQHTDYQSPLFSRRELVGYSRTTNAAYSGIYWELKGKVPKDKILLGIPSYGRSYKLAYANETGFRDPAVSVGVNKGRVSYTYVCQVLQNGGTRVFDQQTQTPYAYKDLDWFCYEDVQSATAKSKYIRDQNYAGTMVWVFDLDDPNGLCGEKFPINNAVARILNPQ